MSHLTHIAK